MKLLTSLCSCWSLLSLGLVVLVPMAFSGVANADVVHDIVPGDVTTITNNGTVPGLAGTAGALTFTGATDGFNNAGFVGNTDINTILGRPLSSTDTVVMQLNVDSITGGAIRANGVTFGMLGPASSGDSLAINMEAANSGGDINVSGISFQDAGDTSLQVFDGAILNGFEATLTADVNGYTFEIFGVHTTTPQVISGTFAGTEFVDNFGAGALHYKVQKFSQATALVTNISEASVTVVTAVPEPGSLVVLGMSALGLCGIRRRR